MPSEFCPQCGAELPDGANFCMRCGSTVAEVRPDSSVTPERSIFAVADAGVPQPSIPAGTQRRPRVRREKNFIVEENIEAIRWPTECAACQGPAEVSDDLRLERNIKALGKIHVEVPGIPYCRACAPKVRRHRGLDRVRYVVALVLGIPIGLLLIVATARQPGTRFIWLGLVMLIGIAIGYGLAYLLVKFPVKAIFRAHFVRPVEAWLIQEKKRDGSEGVSVVIHIPNKVYAEKFAQLNGA
jgi:hypothetical protein